MDDYELTQYNKSTAPSASSRPGSVRHLNPEFGGIGDRQGHSREHILHESTLDQTQEGTLPNNGSKSDVYEGTNSKHVTGLKLFFILASVTMAAFLMLLDGSIIGVVSTGSAEVQTTIEADEQGHPENHE